MPIANNGIFFEDLNMKLNPLLPALSALLLSQAALAQEPAPANPEARAAAAATVKKQIGSKPVVLKNVAGLVRYHRSSVEPVVLQGGFFDRLQQAIAQLPKGYQNLIIEVEGHSDNERMSASTAAKFGDNTQLSKMRAERTVEIIQQKINLPSAQFRAIGKGESQPLRPNNSAANRAYNRRGEINLYYDEPLYAEVPAPAPTPVAAPAPVPAPVPVPTPAPAHSDQAVKDALAVKADDEDGNSLKEALSAVDKNYSLIKRGTLSFNYAYSFTYSSTESLELSDTPDTSSGKRYVTDISRDSRYTHRSNLSADYGVLNNLTLGVNVPVVSAHRDGGSSKDSITDTSVGDVSLDMRWQPWETRLGKVNTTFGASASLPTGVSPYKIDTENTVSTGSGTYGFGLSASFSKVIDPVIAYGGISLGHSLAIENLSQQRGSQVLVKVEPQPSISYSMGIGYALSYGVSLNMGFSHSFAQKTKLYYSDDVVTLAKGSLLEQELIGGHAAMANASVGFRVSPGSVLSVNLGVGLTRESPDFTVGLSMPFSFSGFKSAGK